MRFLVFGKTGQVATELQRRGPGQGIEIVAQGRDAADLTDPAACAALIASGDWAAVINAAAYTAVDQAEEEEALAQRINAEAPGAMARAAAARDIPFVHISTDYVFSGEAGREWRETDPVSPLGAYGRTKLAGETAVQEAGGRHAILRTAWVFSAYGRNFLKTMLRVGAERAELRVVDDQRGGPTPADAIADALLTIARTFQSGRPAPGIYHFSGTPVCSWADFAEAIFDAAALPNRPIVTRIATADYPTPATRPPNSALDCSRIRDVFGISQPDWRDGIARALNELERS